MFFRVFMISWVFGFLVSRVYRIYGVLGFFMI